MTKQSLPDEILVEIFNHFCKPDQADDNRVKYRYENYIKVLVLNRRFLELFAKLEFYALVPLCSTRFLRSFESFDDYMSNIISSFNSAIEDPWELLTSENGVFGNTQLGDRPSEHKFRLSKQLKYKEMLVYYQKACVADYEVLELDYKFPSDYLAPDTLSHVHIFRNFDSLELFCSRVMNNHKSFMRKYIKSFNIDLMFLDEFQTARASHKETLFNSILKKYNHKGISLSPKIKPFKCFSNIFASRIENPLSPAIPNRVDFDTHLDEIEEIDPETPGPASYSARLTRRNYRRTLYTLSEVINEEPYVVIGDVVQEEQWPFFKQLLMCSCFMQLFYSTGKRHPLSKLSIAAHIQETLEAYAFKEFREFDSLRIPRRGFIGGNLDITSSQTVCTRKCVLLISKILNKRPTEHFLSRAKVGTLIEELVKAATVNSPDHCDTSLLTFSLKSEDVSNKEAFEMVKPKIIVINSPARSSDADVS